MWWGGYCYHGQILFPTWHRAYVYRLENALRSIKGCENVTLPFLDWCDSDTLTTGLPDTFCQKQFTLGDGTIIRNPLYSYVFQTGVFDSLSTFPDTDYSKPKDYETVRYPLSGLVGLPKTNQASVTAAYNATFEYPKNLKPLNDNIKSWLRFGVELDSGDPVPIGTAQKFRECLDAPNYVVFSNTSSATKFNQDNLQVEGTGKHMVVPLEMPHNSMHLAVGGYHIPTDPVNVNPNPKDPVPGLANGDMVRLTQLQLRDWAIADSIQGENDTASFDPIFFFHHCFVDRMFWLWQQKHNQTTQLVIDPEYQRYRGTNNFDGGQGPTPGRHAGTWLDLDTPLEPFVNVDGSFMKSTDVVDIEGSLGYTYGPGSFTDQNAQPTVEVGSPQLAAPPAQHFLAVSGVNRGAIRGSFLISTWARDGDDEFGSKKLLDVHPVLSRWQTAGCANCQTHLNVKTFVPLHGVEDSSKVEVLVHTHDEPAGKGAEAHPNLKTVPISPKPATNGS